MIETVEMVRNLKADSFSINITNDGHEDSLYDGIVEHCAKSLTDSELKIVHMRCIEQLLSMGINDIPYRFKEMMQDLNKAMIHRNLL